MAASQGKTVEEIAGQFAKGDSIALSGTLRINTYDKDGAKNRVAEVTVEHARESLDNVPAKNETRLVGIIREDPKVRELRGEKSMTTISIATTATVNGRSREDWHSGTAWGNTGLAACDIKAGDTIEVVGPLRHRMLGDQGTKRKLSIIEFQRFRVLERTRPLQVGPRVPPPGKGMDRDVESPHTALAPAYPSASVSYHYDVRVWRIR